MMWAGSAIDTQDDYSFVVAKTLFNREPYLVQIGLS